MLKIFVILSTIPLLLPLIYLYNTAREVNKRYNLMIFRIESSVALFSIFYVIVNLIANISPSLEFSFFLFNVSIVLIVISGLLLYIYFYALRATRISITIITLCCLIVLMKIISLILSPLKVFFYDDIFLREAHLSPMSLFISVTIIFLILFEIIRLHVEIKNKVEYRKYSAYLVGVYSLIIIMIPLFILGQINILISILIPYFQGILASVIMLYILLLFRKNCERLVLLPIYVKGVLLHTYGGLAVIRKAIDSRFQRLIALSSALVASLISIESAIEDFKNKYAIKSYNLIETTILVFFGKFSVGTIILNRDNIVVRDILRRIVLDFEREVKYIDEGMLTDYEIEIAERILDKYISFVI